MAFKNTPEQEKIINYTGSLLVVKAFAGTGKTSTLINYAKKHDEKKLLYIAFNRAIRDEASQKFPKNVDCKTAHQVAYAVYGRKYRHKLEHNITNWQIAECLPSVDGKLFNLIKKTLNNFLASSDPYVLIGHVREDVDEESSSAERLPSNHQIIDSEEIASFVELIWEKMKDVDSKVPMTHDGYLKLYQLSQPDLSISYDAIMIDEAQDITPVVNAIVLAQKATLIYVGDPHQQIYRWRGAENAMDYKILKEAEHLNLTNSFRFGPTIAMIANAILEYKGEQLSIIGRGGEDRVLKTIPREEKPYTIISRTVADVVNNARLAIQNNQKVYWVGGIESYSILSLLDIYWFSMKTEDKIVDRTILQRYESYDQYVSQAEESKDTGMLRNIKIINEVQDVPSFIQKLRKLTVTKENQADVILTTAHRSKGLEWRTVMISDDYPELYHLVDKPSALSDELNLLYVASTRATKHLIVNSTIKKILARVIENRSKE